MSGTPSWHFSHLTHFLSQYQPSNQPQVTTRIVMRKYEAHYWFGMSMSEFKTFRDLLRHCLTCHDTGVSQQALALVDEYLSDARADRPPEAFWSQYNVQQALGFRVAFTENVAPASAPAAEERHLAFCQHQLKYWLSAAADSSARLALARFKVGDVKGGRVASEEAARLAGALGQISATVAQAAEEARKTSL